MYPPACLPACLATPHWPAVHVPVGLPAQPFFSSSSPPSQDWLGLVGPTLNLRLNTPGWTSVRAVASRGDLPDSQTVSAAFFVNRSAPCAAAGACAGSPSHGYPALSCPPPLQ